MRALDGFRLHIVQTASTTFSHISHEEEITAPLFLISVCSKFTRMDVQELDLIPNKEIEICLGQKRAKSQHFNIQENFL